MKRSKPRQSARKLAWEILSAVEAGTSLLELSLTKTLQASGLDLRDQNLAEKIVKGVLEERSYLEKELTTCLTGKLKKLSKRVQTILRIGAYQILCLERVPNEVAVNESVNLAKQVTDRRQANLVNAVLRSLASKDRKPEQQRLDSPEDIAEALSHPIWIIQRWIAQIGKEETIALCRFNNTQWPLYARVNTLRCHREELIKRLTLEGISSLPCSFDEDCLKIQNLPSSIDTLTSFQDGLFLFQDVSSVLMAKALGANPGEDILDLCSAPGGKTTLLAAMMQNTGSILAVDVSQTRLAQVEENCNRLGVANTTTLCCDATTLDSNRRFDRILIDAPCTGLGTLGRKKDLRWNRNETDIEELVSLQQQLLSHAATLLKPSGIIVYSTCSIDSSENEEVVDSFLDHHDNFSLSPLTELPTTLLNDRGELRSWPHRHHMSGGFAARLTASAALSSP